MIDKALLVRLNDATKPVDAADRNLIIRALTQKSKAYHAAVVEECIQFIMNGSFLHDEAPPKMFAKELTAAMRSQMIP